MTDRCGWILAAWISMACSVTNAVDSLTPVERTIHEVPLEASDRDHWSFRPIEAVALPMVAMRDWPTSPVDSFVLAQLEAANLTPAAMADRRTLLRRWKFGLHGLPPTIEELAAFENDRAADAHERCVDRLLASPRYGEHWAQWWLDLARFAETDGFEHDRVRKDAWRYRDWVIQALNQDLPYDQFVTRQLAGDDDPDTTIATMFCLAGPDMPDLNDQTLRRHDRLNELTSTVGSALLGLQFHCAQCHDHKNDPLSQADFYRLRAVFENAIPELVRDKPYNTFASVMPKADAHFYFRGELSQRGPMVRAAMPRIATDLTDSVHYCETESPRAEFARWLFSESNPLTARVIVNRIWQQHFGRGLVENASDFGIALGGPTHPELMDWLSTEVRRSGWSLKALHRMIVLSATYGQQGFGEAGDRAWESRLERDPANRLLSRFPRLRLNAEAVRDAMLATAGVLHFETGGEGVMPPLPDELIGTLLKGQWKASDDPGDHSRRSVFIFARRNLRYPVLEAFDRPDALTSCPQRNRSTTAIQALQMFNSELSFDCSRRLRDRINALAGESVETDSHSAFIDLLFRLTLARPASPEEQRLFDAFIRQSSHPSKESLLAACLAIINCNEFVYVD